MPVYMILESCPKLLNELKTLILQLKKEDYCQPNPVLISSSIGQHIRHILELFECLLDQYEGGIICYDTRKRDLELETDPLSAIQKLEDMGFRLSKPDKSLLLISEVDGLSCAFKTSYLRELWYNLEHGIHHQAIIKLACAPLDYVTLPKHFGVAPSTQVHQKSVQPTI